MPVRFGVGLRSQGQGGHAAHFDDVVVGAAVGGQRRVGGRRVTEVQPLVIVEDLHHGRVSIDHHPGFGEARVDHLGRRDVQQEVLVGLEVGIAFDDQGDGHGHFRLGLPGDHQAALLALDRLPDNEALAHQRVPVVIVEVAGDVLRLVVRADLLVQHFPVVSQLQRFPDHLVADNAGIRILDESVGRNVLGSSTGDVITEDVPVSAVEGVVGVDSVVALPDHVLAGYPGTVIVVGVVGNLRSHAVTGGGGSVGVVLKEHNFVVGAVVSLPDDVVAVDVRRPIAHRVGGH